MSITVYWSMIGSHASEQMRAQEPFQFLKHHLDGKDIKKLEYPFCPAFKDYFKNTFCITSPYDYEFALDPNAERAKSNMWDQKFFDEHVLLRSYDYKLASFIMPFIFFTEEKSLEITLFQPWLEDNDFNKECKSIPGTFDMAKWFRNLDSAFYMTNGRFKINEGDIWSYIKFHTDKPIKFKRFIWTDKLEQYAKLVGDSKLHKIHYRPLQYYYDIFKNYGLKKKILKEIKENLC